MADAATIFVHGLYSSASAWRNFNELLSQDPSVRNDFDFYLFDYSTPITNWNPARRPPDLNTIADSFRGYLESLPERYRRVVVVTHSQGGLVVQRFLSRSLADGRGEQLAQIRRIVMFACPNNGSEFMLLLRRSVMPLLRNRQERELRPLQDSVLETQRRVMNGVVHATTIGRDRCPIPIMALAGDADNIVRPMSAASVFPMSGVIPGDHSTIIRPTSYEDRSYGALVRELQLALTEPFPNTVSTLAFGGDDTRWIDIRTELRTFEPVYLRFGSLDPVQFVVHAGPIEQISNVDILVSSENVYFQMAQFFKPSISGRLRRAAARKGPAGEVIDDVASDELIEWMRSHARYGLPVELGTVAATSSGDLLQQGISRIYHAATANPRPSNSGYSVISQGVTRAVHQVFSVARRERVELNLPLRSICFPLLGAGRAGLNAKTSFDWIWTALRKELEADDSWIIHFVAWRVDDAQMILRELLSSEHSEQEI